MPGAPSRAATDRPESSARAIRPEASAAARALSSGVADEGRLGLLGLGQAQLAGGDHLETAVQQGGDLARLAGIVGGGDQPSGSAAGPERHSSPTAARCMATSSAMPWRARSNRLSNSAWVKPRFSPVAWISTMPPSRSARNCCRPRRWSPRRSRGPAPGRPVEDAAGDRRDLVDDRVASSACLRPAGSCVASFSATQAPVIAAVRVPPSAWITSQSRVIWRSPRAFRSTTARSERPISRWISWVRPDCLPGRGLAAAAGMGGARQHAVFGRDPALALAPQEAAARSLPRWR